MSERDSAPDEREFEVRLGEYLSGEMDADETRAFEALLANDPARRQLADELRETGALVRAAVPSAELAEQCTRGLSLGRSDRNAGRAAGWRIAAAALRYAAVILLAFALGFMARGWESGPANTRPAAPSVRTPYEVQFARNYTEVSREHPGTSSFGRTLLAIARR